MSKSTSQAKRKAEDATTKIGIDNGQLSPQSESIEKQFLLTLTSPRIILVADAANKETDCPCVTLSMGHLHVLRQTSLSKEAHSMFCDGLELFTGTARSLSPQSSLLCPLSISGSLTRILQTKLLPQQLSGWVWFEALQAHASYTDLTHAINVYDGVIKQAMSAQSQGRRGNSTQVAQPTMGSSSFNSSNEKKLALSQGRM